MKRKNAMKEEEEEEEEEEKWEGGGRSSNWKQGLVQAHGGYKRGAPLGLAVVWLFFSMLAAWALRSAQPKKRGRENEKKQNRRKKEKKGGGDWSRNFNEGDKRERDCV